MIVETEQRVVKATTTALSAFTRKSLREYAKYLSVDRGRNKKDVVVNLVNSGKATMLVILGN